MTKPLSREEIEILLVHPERGLNVVPALCRQLLDAMDRIAELEKHFAESNDRRAMKPPNSGGK